MVEEEEEDEEEEDAGIDANADNATKRATRKPQYQEGEQYQPGDELLARSTRNVTGYVMVDTVTEGTRGTLLSLAPTLTRV